MKLLGDLHLPLFGLERVLLHQDLQDRDGPGDIGRVVGQIGRLVFQLGLELGGFRGGRGGLL